MDKIQEIFKIMDKKIKEEEEEKEKNAINEKENKKYINVGVEEKEINLFKEIVKNSKEIPEDLKQIEDSKIKDLLLFKNLFKYNNNYLYNNNDVNYIGSSASVVLINDTNVITAKLGITTCILFNKEGEIKNLKDSNNNSKELNEIRNEHTFNNKEEKRRIKKFNQEIDYNKLKLNIYVPASRCFGLFKYKKDEILKEENQIISCVPDVRIYDKNDIDYILLMTKGMIDIVGDNLKQFIEKIVNNLKEQKDNNEKKLSTIIEEYIKQNEIENEKNKSDLKYKNNINNNMSNLPLNKVNSSIYVGKDDFSEENTIINELNNNYYKDIMNINKMNDPNFNGKSNTTCILIQLLKTKKRIAKKDNIENGEDKKKEEKIIEKEQGQLEKDNINKPEKNEDELKKNEIEGEKEKLENDKIEEKDNKIEENKENEKKIKEEKEEIQNKKDETSINKNSEVNNNMKDEKKNENQNKKEDKKEEEKKVEEIQKDKNNSEIEKNKIKDDIKSEERKEVKSEIKEEQIKEEKKNDEKEKKNENSLKDAKDLVDSLKNNDSNNSKENKE